MGLFISNIPCGSVEIQHLKRFGSEMPMGDRMVCVTMHNVDLFVLLEKIREISPSDPKVAKAIAQLKG